MGAPPWATLIMSIRLIYLLNPTSDVPSALKKSLAKGDIYRIDFSYRGGVDTDPAFILMDEAESMWMLVSEENEIEFVALQQAAISKTNDQDEISETEDENDDLDFGML